jgi:hypothetical protein
MDLSLILAAAEHAAEATNEHHKSELPFFLAGGVLAAATESAARGVMAISGVLVAATMAAIVYVST